MGFSFLTGWVGWSPSQPTSKSAIGRRGSIYGGLLLRLHGLLWRLLAVPGDEAAVSAIAGIFCELDNLAHDAGDNFLVWWSGDRFESVDGRSAHSTSSAIGASPH